MAVIDTGECAGASASAPFKLNGDCLTRPRNISPSLTTAERMDVYRSIFRLNCAFHVAVQSLDDLAQFFSRKDLRDMRGLTQEVQTEINGLMLERLHSIEMDDWAQFGKIRIALEKRLRGTERGEKEKSK
jgi:hypothetical protein